MARKSRNETNIETQEGKRGYDEQAEKQALTVKDNDIAAETASQLKGGTSDVHQQLQHTASNIDGILNQKIDVQKTEMRKKTEAGKVIEDETAEASDHSKADAELQQRRSSKIDDSKTRAELEKGASESSKDAQFLDNEKNQKETDRKGAEETTKQQESEVNNKKVNVS